VTRDLVVQFLAQGAQMTLVLLIAPLAVGVVRRVKARLMRRQGPPLLQAYLDLAKLLRKESVIAEGASWLFRSAPYLIFALTWVAAALSRASPRGCCSTGRPTSWRWSPCWGRPAPCWRWPAWMSAPVSAASARRAR